MSRKIKINNITSDEAIHDILRFVENEDRGEESDIEDLFGDDTNIQLKYNNFITNQTILRVTVNL